MGLTDWAKNAVLGKLLKPLFGPILSGIEWLNAYPGRKKSIAALFLGISAALRVFGSEDAAQGVEGFNTILQGLTTSSDIIGALMGIWGIVHPWVASHETLQTQATNVLLKVEAKTPEASPEVKMLQDNAIRASQKAVMVVQDEEAKK